MYKARFSLNFEGYSCYNILDIYISGAILTSIFEHDCESTCVSVKHNVCKSSVKNWYDVFNEWSNSLISLRSKTASWPVCQVEHGGNLVTLFFVQIKPFKWSCCLWRFISRKAYCQSTDCNSSGKVDYWTERRLPLQSQRLASFLVVTHKANWKRKTYQVVDDQGWTWRESLKLDLSLRGIEILMSRWNGKIKQQPPWSEFSLWSYKMQSREKHQQQKRKEERESHNKKCEMQL